MPPFNGLGVTSCPATSICSGVQLTMVNAETPAAGYVSIVLSRALDSQDKAVTFTVSWASSPSATVEILGSNIAPTVNGFDPNGFIVATGATQSWEASDGLYRFYQVKVAAYSSGGALTVIAQR